MRYPQIPIKVSNELIKCGKYLSDEEHVSNNGYLRIREIEYDGCVYRHVMFIGNVINITIK